jgi:hypothetical protein
VHGQQRYKTIGNTFGELGTSTLGFGTKNGLLGDPALCFDQAAEASG